MRKHFPTSRIYGRDGSSSGGGGGASYTFSNGLRESGGAVKLSDVANVTEDVAIGSESGNQITLSNYETPDLLHGSGVFVNTTSLIFTHVSVDDDLQISMNISDAGTFYFDSSPGGAGIQYSGDYSANFTERSLIDVGYTKNFLFGLPASGLDSPGPGNNGQGPVWNDTNQQWEFGGGTFTFENGVIDIGGGVVQWGGPLITTTQIDAQANYIDFINVDGHFDITGATQGRMRVDFGPHEFEIGDAIGGLFRSTEIEIDAVNSMDIHLADSEIFLNNTTIRLFQNAGGSVGIVMENDTITFSGSDPSFPGAQYDADYSATFTARSIPDFGYTTTHLGEAALNFLVINPTASEDGFVVSWNDTNQEYELVAPGGGGGVSFGTVDQIPFMNAGGNDFDYSANLTFDNSNILRLGDAFTNFALFAATGITGGGPSYQINPRLSTSGNPFGAALNLLSGTGFAGGNNPGGILEIHSGNGQGSANAGNIQIISGSNLTGAGGGGDILIRTGVGNSGALPGRVLAETGRIDLGQPGVDTITEIRGSAGINAAPDGIDVSILGGNGYASAGDGDGGDVLIQSGQRRVAGSGTDGNIILDVLTGRLRILGIPTSASGLSAGDVWSNGGVLTLV